jgi:hypothetical protein
MALGSCPCLPGCLCWPAAQLAVLAVLSGWPCCRAGRLPVLAVTRMSVLAGRPAGWRRTTASARLRGSDGRA